MDGRLYTIVELIWKLIQSTIVPTLVLVDIFWLRERGLLLLQPLNNPPPLLSCLSLVLGSSYLPTYLPPRKAGPRTKIHYTPGLEKLFLDNCKVLRSVQCYETTATLDSFLQIKLITKAE